jgi:hypothetical protein
MNFFFSIKPLVCYKKYWLYMTIVTIKSESMCKWIFLKINKEYMGGFLAKGGVGTKNFFIKFY